MDVLLGEGRLDDLTPSTSWIDLGGQELGRSLLLARFWTWRVAAGMFMGSARHCRNSVGVNGHWRCKGGRVPSCEKKMCRLQNAVTTSTVKSCVIGTLSRASVAPAASSRCENLHPLPTPCPALGQCPPGYNGNERRIWHQRTRNGNIFVSSRPRPHSWRWASPFSHLRLTGMLN